MLTRRKKIDRKYVLFGIIILIFIILIVYSKTLDEDRKLSPVESLLKDSVTFVEKIIFYPFNNSL